MIKNWSSPLSYPPLVEDHLFLENKWWQSFTICTDKDVDSNVFTTWPSTNLMKIFHTSFTQDFFWGDICAKFYLITILEMYSHIFTLWIQSSRLNLFWIFQKKRWWCWYWLLQLSSYLDVVVFILLVLASILKTSPSNLCQECH